MEVPTLLFPRLTFFALYSCRADLHMQCLSFVVVKSIPKWVIVLNLWFFQTPPSLPEAFIIFFMHKQLNGLLRPELQEIVLVLLPPIALQVTLAMYHAAYSVEGEAIQCLNHESVVATCHYLKLDVVLFLINLKWTDAYYR